MYAVLEGEWGVAERTLHLYRLADGAHSTVPNPDALIAGTPLYIDRDEVWYFGMSGAVNATVLRQRIDVLRPD
jgi:hypothetical protein